MDVIEVDDGDDDRAIAERLQLEEVLRFSIRFRDRFVRPEAAPSLLQIVDDAGESSSSRQVGTFDCVICMETLPLSESFVVAACEHMFCAPCIRQYVATKMSENAIPVKCPNLGCEEGILEPEACKEIIPEELFDRWGFALCESAIGANQKIYCPFRDCSVPTELPAGDEGIYDTECPHCHRLFCARCLVPWHEGVECEEYQKLGEDERGKEDLMLRKMAGDQKWQRCPQCKMYVERTEGCVYIVCRCGFSFCYRCGWPMPPSTHHFCEICKKTWD